MNMSSLCAKVAFIVTTLGCATCQSPVLSTRNYLLESRIAYPIAVPPFSSRSTKCDAQGNTFFEIAGTSKSSVKVILAVPRNGGEPTPIVLPKDLGSTGEWRISADAGGMLFALYSEGSKHVLISFTPSGMEVRRITLQLPRYFQVHSFAVNQAGNGIFFGGAPVSDNAAVTRHRLQTIWMNRDGESVLVSPLGRSIDLSVERPDGQVVEGPTGTFFQVNHSSLTSFDEKGNVLRTISIPPAPPGAYVSSMQYVGGRAAIEWAYRSQTDSGIAADAQNNEAQYGPLTQTWMLVNPDSGVAEGFFRLPDTFTGSALCYVGAHQFTYLIVVDGHPTLIEAAEKAF